MPMVSFSFLSDIPLDIPVVPTVWYVQERMGWSISSMAGQNEEIFAKAKYQVLAAIGNFVVIIPIIRGNHSCFSTSYMQLFHWIYGITEWLSAWTALYLIYLFFNGTTHYIPYTYNLFNFIHHILKSKLSYILEIGSIHHWLLFLFSWPFSNGSLLVGKAEKHFPPNSLFIGESSF